MSDKIININSFDLSGYEVIRPDRSYVIDARESSGLTQQQVADALEMPLDMYQLYEAGKLDINDQVLRRIWDTLNKLSVNK